MSLKLLDISSQRFLTVVCYSYTLTNKYIALHLVGVRGEGEHDEQQVEAGLRQRAVQVRHRLREY